jgi:hypothetical protein
MSNRDDFDSVRIVRNNEMPSFIGTSIVFDPA